MFPRRGYYSLHASAFCKSLRHVCGARAAPSYAHQPHVQRFVLFCLKKSAAPAARAAAAHAMITIFGDAVARVLSVEILRP
jgi:hypothetical protein